MLRGIHLNAQKFNIDFIRIRMVSYIISGLILATSIGFYFFNGLNFGIDFSGGTVMEVRFSSPIDIGKIRSDLGSVTAGEIFLQEFGTPQDLLIRIDQKNRTEEEQLDVVNQIKNLLNSDATYRRIENVGPKMGGELISDSIQAVLWAMLAMLIYIWIRFEWHFGVCAVIALMHDAVAVFGLYSVFGLEFNASAIVSILITIGYSINDTVVIYDRIRENLRKFKSKKIDALLNLSINETLSRTILTSATTLLALSALYGLGGKTIQDYSLPILIGVAVGTYSSIFIASPLLSTFGMDLRSAEKDAEQNTTVKN
ncbi:MAG: protein translocase subunit SecF [Holosporaceae bacterium]|nr:MAG: protein translocase subunit SecF [Holosporaceae bacterium]